MKPSPGRVLVGVLLLVAGIVVSLVLVRRYERPDREDSVRLRVLARSGHDCGSRKKVLE